MPHECTTCGQQFDDGSKEMLSGCPNCGGNKFQFKPPNRDSEPDERASVGGSGEPASTADPDAPEGEPTSTTEQSDAVPTTEQSDAGSGGEIDLPDDTAHAADAAGEEAADAVDADTTATAGADDELRDAEEFRDAEIADETGAENSAQRDARSAAASPDEIDDARRQVSDAESQASPEEASPGRGTPQGPPAETPSGSDPDEFDLSGALGPEDAESVEKQPVAGSAPEREEPVADEDTDLRALREELNQQFESIKITAPGQYELNLMELYDRKEYIISLQEDGRYVIEMADDYGIDD